MKPNIFDISTKELSQDAFITWLLLWADNTNASFDINLNKCAAELITELIKKEIPNFNEQIITVRAGRQWRNIDVWAEVNNKYAIIIEDKTYTGQHSGQLRRYKETTKEWCNEQTPKYHAPICIYLKTGNESQQSLNLVKNEGFKIYNRLEFIALLQNHEINNDIYNDFKSRLFKIEKINNEWENKLINEWKGNDWQGFYQYLEKQINIVGWDYVNNKSGGFWNAVLNWDYWGIYPVYLQTEQYKLCFKISTHPDDVDMPDNVHRGDIRNEISEIILDSASERELKLIRRPDKFGDGNYMTVAFVDSDNWLGDKEDKINKEKVKERLKNYIDFLLDTIKNAC
jgi:hypothetical protein